MKRSEINKHIVWAKSLLEANNIRLPDLAYMSPEAVQSAGIALTTVKSVMLGWDITDFGTGNFEQTGAVLYTVRNGSLENPAVGVPYCEKYILMKAGQYLPMHYHVLKTEDIIVRAGGILKVNLWNTDEKGACLDTDVHVYMDGFERTFKAGQDILVTKGNSISLTPGLAHVFGPLDGTDEIILGEVSKVNDDKTDNYFLEPTSRFSKIEEDEPPIHLLCSEYR